MNRWIALGALLGFLGVALGAFGAHAIRDRITPDLLAIYQTGVHYHQIHALALVGLGLWEGQKGSTKTTTAAGIALLMGILIFSGTLYLLAITGTRWWGAITPIGGLSLQIGWICFAVSAWKRPAQV